MKVIFAIAVLMLAVASSSASACGRCEYKEKLTGVCLPKIGCSSEQLDPINPVVQVKKVVALGAAVASGNSDQIKASLGDVLINSSNCLSCPAMAHTVLPDLTDEQINRVVGSGALIFAATYDPYFVTVDVVANIAREQRVSKERSAASPFAPPAENTARQALTYSAEAECMVINNGDGMIYAAWTSPATFRDPAGVAYQFPSIDLLPGDSINVTAPACAAWDSPESGARAITSATMLYEVVSSLTGDENALKWIVAGKAISTAAPEPAIN